VADARHTDRGLLPKFVPYGGKLVNAAFLLVTTAWLAGADAAPTAAPATPPAATSSCTGDCGACCDHEGLWSKLKGRLHHGDDCCEPCPKPKCAPAPKCKPCDTCPKESCLDKLKSRLHHADDCNACAKPACAPAPKATCGSCGSCCEETLGSKLKGKLHGLLHHDKDCCNDCGTAPGKGGEPIKAPKDGEPGKKLPSGDKEANVPGEPLITPVSGSESKSPFELSPRYESRAGHAPDYSWLTGQLFYVHADGGLWVLRYAPLSTEDSNGGGVVIARDLRMDSYRDGDLVTVHGELLGQKSSLFLGGPLYRGKTIELIERGSTVE
jgi:hypothetical protein